MEEKQNKKLFATSVLVALIIVLGFILPISISNHMVKVGSETAGGKTNIIATPDYCFKGVYCIRDLLAEREGYARNATGGLNGYIYFVTSLEDDPNNPQPGTLRHALTQPEPLWIFFLVNGTIVLKDRISVTSDKTIDGRGAQITITTRFGGSARGQALRIYDARNIIIVNIRFDSTDTQNIDAIEIRRSTNIWIHHCDFTNWSDGTVDLAEALSTGTSNITISWSRFWNHVKVTLIGNTATRTTDRNFRVTLHHNFYFMTEYRHPRLRFGIVDMYNNYLYWVGEGSSISQGGIVYAEANIYELVPGKDTEIADCTWPGEAPGYFFNISNRIIRPPGANAIIDGCWTNITYSRPYPARVEPANEDLKRKIMMYAGTDFPLSPRLMTYHPMILWGEYEWDLPLPAYISGLTAYFIIDVTPYKSPENEIIEIEWYMGDGTKYVGTPLDFLNLTTRDLVVRHTYSAPGIYNIIVLMKTVGGSILLVSSTAYVNISMVQTIAPVVVLVTPSPATVTSPTTYTSMYTTTSVRTLTTAVPTTITSTIEKTYTTSYVTTQTIAMPTTVTSAVTTTMATTASVTVPTTVLVSVASPTTVVSEKTITTTASPTTIREVEWTTTAIVGIVLLGVGLGVGSLFLRRR
ncbi:MAG: hypothetical protein QXT53_05300 [Ignisphaera sp.]